jgi:hypothetical protein
MTNHERLTSARPRPLPGTGRLGVVATYFTLAGLGTAVITVFAAKAFLAAGWHEGFASDAAYATVVGSLLTYGYVRTDRLLSRRQKTGGYAALICLSGTILSSFVTGGSRFMTGVALAGLGLLASVWQHLE